MRAWQQRRLVPGAQGWHSHGSGSEKDLEPPARPGPVPDRGPAVCPAVTPSPIPRALSSAGGPRASEGATGFGSPSPEQSFRAAGALRLGKGNFHRARSSAPRSAEPSAPGSGSVSSAFSGSQLPSSLLGAKPAGGRGGGGLYGTQLQAKRLRLSCCRPPLPESSHLSGGGGWGAARPCSGGSGDSCFFHHPEDAPAGTAGSPRRSTASDWPGRIVHTQLSAKEPASAALLCPPRSRHQLLWPGRNPGRESPRRRAKAAPGKMLLPASPYAEPLQRARAGLCAAPARRRRVGARRRLSLWLLPFAALPSSSARPAPAPLATPAPAAATEAAALGAGDAGLDLQRRYLGRYSCGGWDSNPWAKRRGAHAGLGALGRPGVWETWILREAAGLTRRFRSRKELVIKFGQKSSNGLPLRSSPGVSTAWLLREPRKSRPRPGALRGRQAPLVGFLLPAHPFQLP